MPPFSAYAGIFVLAGSIILFQVALTRVFAIMMWHHFTYMVVSIALLGFGAAGSFLTARAEGLKHDAPSKPVARAALWYGIAVVVTLLLATQLRVNTLKLWSEPSNLGALLLLYGLITIPLFLGGYAVGLALTRFAAHANKIYFADLVGSAAGGAASVALLDAFGGAPTVVLAGAFGALGALAFASGVPGLVRKFAVPVLATCVFAASVTGLGRPLGLPAYEIDVPFATDKEINDLAGTHLDMRLPSATAEVQVSTNIENGPPIMGGNFGALDEMKLDLRAVAQDGTAPTQMFKDAADIARFKFLDDTQAASGYRAFAARGGKDPEVLVIGVGGGVDVMVALAHGASRVDAAEINRAMIRMVTEEYDDYLGGLFRPGAHPYSDKIHLVNSEGRSFMRNSDRRYDLIQMSGVDSFTALSTGAYTLSESYLYTVDAVKEFYEHLKDGGIVTYSRYILSWPKRPRETLRLANIAITALTELGIDDPSSHLAVFQGSSWASTMIKRGPFTRAEIDDLHRFAVAEGFRGFVFDPLFEPGKDLLPLPGDVESALRLFVNAQAPNAAPADVDGAVAALRHATLAEASGLAGTPAPPTPPSLRDALAPRAGEMIAYLRTNSEPFLKTRDIFFHLLRATPAEKERFLADYPYDVSPCTDDTPFFFNYYRYSGLWSKHGRDGVESSEDKAFHPEYPVGHMILLSSLAQIVLLGVALILLPLRALAKKGIQSPHKGRILTYFAALGVGFMCIEIVLMQKVVIVLGHPTYALSVVLSSLLGFAGIGSFLAAKLDARCPKTLMRLGLAVAVLIVVTAIGMNVLPPMLLGLGFGVRVLAVVLLLAPIGIALGMPFPTGVRALESTSPQLVPWAWAINGFSSVFASLACIVASMAVGFTVVFVAAAVIYLVGFAALTRVVRTA
ncbi:MAG: hypothetical protein JNL94_12010 [Planctomycetes bacterium]|nr:hypothetical protein [Planctomycetota bacterium]